MEETLKILVVDDDQADRMTVRRALETAGVQIELSEVYDSASAIAALKQQFFDCALLNYRLPDGDGLTLVQAVRQAGIPVALIVLTAQGDEQIAVELMKAGASDYLSKSKISSEVISQSLTNAIRLQRAEVQATLANQRLREGEERYRLVLEGSNDGIWDWDISNDVLYWNDRLLEIVGVSRSQFDGTWRTFYKLTHPEDQQKIRDALIAHLLEQVEEYNVEFRLRHASGEYRYCVCRGKAQRNERGIPLRMAGMISDITKRKKVEDENTQLYRQAQEVGENLRQAILVLGQQQQQLRILQQLTNLLNQRLTDLPDLLQVMVREVCDAIYGAQFCLIALHTPWCDRLELTATAGVGLEKLPMEHPFYAKEGLLSQVFLTGKSQLVQGESLYEQSDLPRHTLEAGGSIPATICAVAIASAQAGKLGVLAIGNWQDPTAFDREDQFLLTAVGEQAAIAINNAQLISTLEEREERLALQNDILARQNWELERQRHQIQVQNLQLLEASQLKSQFLATMSHELRTPMNAIIGFSQLLLRQNHNKLSVQQADMVKRIVNNGKNLLTLINDILDFSRIEADRLELKLEKFNLKQLVTATTEELRSLVEQKNLALCIHSDLPNPYIINDSSRLRQVLVNLLSNAIKFTEAGSVRVEVDELSSDQVAITIQDTGIGIAQANLEHIFEEFRQVDQTTTRKHAGTGLGLAITSSLVRMMNGTITVKSQLGEGSTFRVELPRQVSL